jgi:uridine phosphorylase
MDLDDREAVIEPQKGKREEDLPPSGILIFTPQDLDLFRRRFPQPPKQSHKVFLVSVFSGVVHDTPIALAGPMIGAPQAILVLEKLIALGVRNVIAVGWCGSLQPHVRIGDVVLPHGALSEEGTSRHYPCNEQEPGPSPELLGILHETLAGVISIIHQGKVWSTDAPYRETKAKVLDYQRQGILAVDMESSALFAVARYRGIRLSVVLIVSDELFSLKWTHGFKEPRFQRNREALADLTLKAACGAARYWSQSPGR